ncbi:MAG: TIGR04282 family arsenosugar biosynthesis glycosyltransferase [Thermoleophilia bacterium]
MTETVLIVAKAPVPGRSKTRLAPPLTPDEAADLQRALLLDTLAGCRAEFPQTALLYSAPDDVRVLSALAGPATRLVPQEGEGLAAALQYGVARHQTEGPVALVSSDIPGIPAGALRRAFGGLESGADVVLGPALDGGYWLIAMRAFDGAPFRDIPWSTPAVLAVTIERCRAAGLSTILLERWRDIDTPADLAALVRETPPAATRTLDVVARLAATHALACEQTPALVESALLSGSPWRAVIRDRLTANGHESEYTYLAVPRAVFVAAVTDSREILLVRQYRHPVRDWTLEVPAGSLLDGESPADAALRELAEETGGRARELMHLTTFYSSSAHLSLRSDVFLATGVEVGEATPDENEDVTTVRMPLAEAVARARKGGFVEGQTALAILLAAERLEGRSRTANERSTHGR